jgi:hypothetical protein
MLSMRGKLFATVFLVFFIAGYSWAAEVTYEKDIKKIITEKCISCHGSDAPTMDEFKKDKEGFTKKMKGPKMDTYKNLMVFVNGDDAGAVMRRLDDGKSTKDGKPGNMHQYLGGTDAEKAKNLETFKKWVGSWNLKKKPDITPDEAKAIKAPEK